jgi:hypothetical protein
LTYTTVFAHGEKGFRVAMLIIAREKLSAFAFCSPVRRERPAGSV